MFWDVFAVQGLFAIIEFETEESAQRVLSHNEDILLRGRRLVVRPRRLKQTVAAASDDHDNDSVDAAKQTATEQHSQLLSKLTSCSMVCISLLTNLLHLLCYHCMCGTFKYDLL